MDKIYSRPRLPRLGINTNKRKLFNLYKKKIIILITILVIGWLVATTILDAITPVIERECRVIARSTASKYANEACNKAMQNLTYDDLCTIERDEDGRVRLVKMNVITINKLNSSIALEVQDKLNQSETSSFYIRWGTLTGSKILCGRGPKLEIIMNTIGDVTTKIESKFEETSINQTLHKIYIDINCNVSMITRFKDLDENIKSEILLAETVISGDAPESYYNLEGISEGDTMNMMN